ncbi:MAG: hypothetical protein MI757_20910 [Pirellulales bacterium]|nr:hypothetical protein [Pirellulales bacterium]
MRLLACAAIGVLLAIEASAVRLLAAEAGETSPENLMQRAAKAYKAKDAKALFACYHSSNDSDRQWATWFVRRALLASRAQKLFDDGVKKYGKDAFKQAIGPFAKAVIPSALANVLEHPDTLVIRSPSKEEMEFGLTDTIISYRSKELARLDDLDIELDHTLYARKIDGRWYLSANKGVRKNARLRLKIGSIVNDFVLLAPVAMNTSDTAAAFAAKIEPHKAKLTAAQELKEAKAKQ